MSSVFRIKCIKNSGTMTLSSYLVLKLSNLIKSFYFPNRDTFHEKKKYKYKQGGRKNGISSLHCVLDSILDMQFIMPLFYLRSTCQ